MLNYNDDTLVEQLYAGLLHKDHESMNTDGRKRDLKQTSWWAQRRKMEVPVPLENKNFVENQILY